MKKQLVISGLVMLAFGTTNFKMKNEKKMKKTQKYVAEIKVNLPAEQVWDVMKNEYGNVSTYAYLLTSSAYINGHQYASEGCERQCYFDDKQSKYVKERMIDVDDTDMSYTNVVYKTDGVPLDDQYTTTRFKVTPVSAESCTISAASEYRTKPAIIGQLFNKKFKQNMEDYLISVAYYARTKEKIDKKKFKEIKKAYYKGEKNILVHE